MLHSLMLMQPLACPRHAQQVTDVQAAVDVLAEEAGGQLEQPAAP